MVNLCVDPEGSSMRYVLGLDLGTSSLKAVLLGEDGVVAAGATETYTIQSPRPGWAEQDPEHWWQACGAACRALLARSGIRGGDIVAVGIGGQMHGTVLVDAGGTLLRPAIIWPDTRTTVEAREAQAILVERDLVKRLGGGVSPGFMLATLLWCRRYEPDLWARLGTALLPKDYLRYRLTGLLAGEASDGSGVPAIDLSSGTWSGETLAALDLPLSIMPPLLHSADPAGGLTAEAAAHCGLQPGTTVLCGGSDQATAAIGAGLLHPGSLLISLSTGGTLVTPVPAPVVVAEQGLRTVCHALSLEKMNVSAPDAETDMSAELAGAGYLAHSATLGAGLAAHWLRQILFQDLAGVGDPRLVEEAALAPLGAGGLLFLPYIAGERSPLLDPAASGAFVGLRLQHGRPHLARAALEGIAFSLRHAFEPMQAAGVEAKRVMLAGGLAQSPFMRAILANVLRTPLLPLASPEQSALGGALLAAVQAGFFADLDQACAQAVHYEDAVEPVAADAGRYESLYVQYRGVYPALRQTMHALRTEIP